MTTAFAGAQSGPTVARWFQRLLALTFAVAWLSLGSQVLLLVGSRGLMPAADWLTSLHSRAVSFLDAPTWLWLSATDTALRLRVGVGLLPAVLAFCSNAAPVRTGPRE